MSNIEVRSIRSEMRAVDDEFKIGGYFILFEDETELYDGVFERISANALDKTLDNDIRCLFNHKTDAVLGRTKSSTVTLMKDEKGLYGEVTINQKDSEAMNVYERVKRGDIDQCSFGFEIIAESKEFDNDNNLRILLEEINLHEISIVTFPAYPNTSVSARAKQIEEFKTTRLNERKQALKNKLKGKD